MSRSTHVNQVLLSISCAHTRAATRCAICGTDGANLSAFTTSSPDQAYLAPTRSARSLVLTSQIMSGVPEEPVNLDMGRHRKHNG